MTTELALPETKDSKLVFIDGGLDSTLQEIAEKARAVESDISTDKGRRLIASTAYKVAQSKTALDKLGKDLVAETKRKIAGIDADRKKARDFLDQLKAEIRAPLDEYEAKEKERIDSHNQALQEISWLADFDTPPKSTDITERIEQIDEYAGRDWQEFEAKAISVLKESYKKLDVYFKDAVAREKEQAELECMRKEEEERKKKEREEQIAREASEKAKREAEEKAERERVEAEEKARKEREKVEREKREAEERARQAELDKKRAEEKAKRDKEEAVRKERERVEREQEKERKAQEKREASKRHVKKINAEICEDLIAAFEVPEVTAIQLVELVSSGKVRHMKVEY